MCLDGVQFLATLNSRFLTSLLDGCSERAQSQLSMIPCGHRFFDTRFSFREQAGKKQRGLNLRASHRHVVINRLQGSTDNFQRRTAAVSRSYFCAHQFQRGDDSSHRAPGERFVTHEFTVEVLPGQNSTQHAHGRTGVATVQGCSWSAPLCASSIEFYRVPVSFPVDSEGFEAFESAGAVCCGRKILQVRFPFRDSRQHGVAMGNGFIPRQPYRTGDIPGGTDHNCGAFIHYRGLILDGCFVHFAVGDWKEP